MGKSTSNESSNQLQEKLMDETIDRNDIDISYIVPAQQQLDLGISLQHYQDDDKQCRDSSNKNILQASEIEEQKENNTNSGSYLQQTSNNDPQNKLSHQDQNIQQQNSAYRSSLNNPINYNITQTNGNQSTQDEQILTYSGLAASNEAQREASMIEVNVLKLQNSRVSYQDLDELHEDLLDEREQNEIDEERGIFSFFCKCVRPKKNKSDNWLKHFKLLVKNSRYIENSWSGGLFQLINTRFSDYKNIDSEQQELHKNAQITLDDSKQKRESSQAAFSSKRTTLENGQNTLYSKSLSTDNGKSPSQGGDMITKDLKQVLQNSVILEEDVESLRESLRNEEIFAQFEGNNNMSFDGAQQNSINHMEDLQAKQYPPVSSKQSKAPPRNLKESTTKNSVVNSDIVNQRKNSKLEILGRSIDIVTQQGKQDQKPPKVKVDSKYKNRIRSSSLKKRQMQKSAIRNGSELRNSSVMQNGQNDSRFEDSAYCEDAGDDALGITSNAIKTNTLLINSDILQEKDYELYQAVVYYKTITFVIEQHLVEENNFTQEKPLRVIRDNFIEYYVRQYGKNLQKLEEDQIIDSIQNLKEFVTLYLEIIREYYKLDELVDKCTYADRFITTDNLINFLCSILFQDDAVYSIVYVSHCHFDPKISLKYFKNVKALHQNIQLEVLKVNEEYCLNENTLIKLQKKMAKQNCSINDTNALKGFTFKPPFQKAFEHFKTIAYQRSPVHKLKVIIKTQDLINECIKDFYDYFGIDYADIYYDADNLVGIFSYILIKSEVYDIIAHCKIIENFATKNTLNSHSGYLLVTLQCCIRFIASINANALLNQNRLELFKI